MFVLGCCFVKQTNLGTTDDISFVQERLKIEKNIEEKTFEFFPCNKICTKKKISLFFVALFFLVIYFYWGGGLADDLIICFCHVKKNK